MSDPSLQPRGPLYPVPAPTLRDHGRTAGNALLNWWRGASIDALCVAAMWLVGLLLMHVPLAPVWAIIGGLMTFVPAIGGVIAVIGPVLSVLFSGHDEFRLGLVLGLYALIVIVEQLVIQPLIMRRITRVPIWLSILAPIVLGILIPFWGVLLAPPLLAVVFAFRRPRPAPPPPYRRYR
jgi:predicted PurR-regulated permease PerM